VRSPTGSTGLVATKDSTAERVDAGYGWGLCSLKGPRDDPGTWILACKVLQQFQVQQSGQKP